MSAPAAPLTLAGSLDFSVRHDDYDALNTVWTYNADHYAGGRVLCAAGSTYLHQFVLEGDESYRKRLERAEGLYENLIAKAMGVYLSHVFRREADRSKLTAIHAEASDVDLFGTPAHDFFRAVLEQAVLQGISYVLVDAPREGGFVTEAEAQARRLRPWMELVPAPKVVDWDVETADPARRGALNYVVIRDTIVRGKAPFSRGVTMTRFRIWTRNEWAVYEAQGESATAAALVSYGPNALGVVPLVPCYDRQIAPFRGATIVDEVARKANALWNRSSVRDENFYFQGFSQLVIKSDDKTLGELKLGADRAIKLSRGDDAGYISPSGDTFAAFKDFVQELTESVADLVFARTERQTPTAQVETAEKREIDRAEFVALLHAKSKSIETCERAAWRLWAMYLSSAPDTVESVEVPYPREFRVSDVPAAEWQAMVTAHVESRVDWRLSRHPEESRERAIEAIKENAALEKSLDPIEQRNQQIDATVKAALGRMGATTPPAPEAVAAPGAGQAAGNPAAS